MSDEKNRFIGGLSINPIFADFVETELLPAIGFERAMFWSGVESIINDLTPRNRELLKIRGELQSKINDWHKARQGSDWVHDEYVTFLKDISYLEPSDTFVEIETINVDAELASIAGPQLVVPVSNARFAINAANARWGSLYDALYGTDVIAEDEGRQNTSVYNARRGAAVIRYATEFLDRTLPLVGASHGDVNIYGIDRDEDGVRFVASHANGEALHLKSPAQFVGFKEIESHAQYLFCNNGLHIELLINPDHPIGKDATANLADVILESALTAIQDCEDSVAAVDAVDKVGVYRNWLGLMRGDLTANFMKGGKGIVRTLAKDRVYTSINNEELVLSGRSLLLIRNVGHLMSNDAILDATGDEVFEGILDAIITVAAALTDRRRDGLQPNSRTGSIYIVKPKMHGPAEVAFTDTLFSRVEKLFDLEENTIKIGIMDEERRTTVNLPLCIKAAKSRVVFINTGFLDRTGDEIHTSMHAGKVLPKGAIKEQPWLNAYEDWNVDVGIRCGLPGLAQIGKGMWPKPDEMLQMIETKQVHPESGANCAWVPSPTAATLHAMHYHAVNVQAMQKKLASRPLASIDEILTPPLGDVSTLSADEIQREIENNAQGILGYVVRWIDQGVGCSKVPDITDVGLMEDRATLRISSQHIANWLLHGVTSKEQVLSIFKRMAKVVDNQNNSDASYKRMSEDIDNSIAFQAACALVLEGLYQPNGYTEPLLHQYRLKKKRELAC
ncbi:MAG: malate synthase G [Woeseiaceae bacterium]|nr:malate synthase G [Woeseiaceae bacterium]